MENQNFDWKREWKDEQLECICAFANTDGGILEVGKDNQGQFYPLKNIKKLLEDLPSKIRQQLGIVASVEAVTEDGQEFIRIKVERYTTPISYHGHYYKRSGSTTVELTGSALDEFILRAQGKTWDAVPVPHIKAEELSAEAFEYFRKKALGSNRLTQADLEVTDRELLDSLMLTENDYLKRAAVLLFHKTPEKWSLGAHVKIAYFKNDIEYHDEVRGPLVTLTDKVVEVAYLKYFKGKVTYEGIHRVELYPIPREAFREAVANAIAHADYSANNPIHISVYDDRVEIANNGKLPDKWTVDTLYQKHRSQPYNPFIASTLFRAAVIEAWGRGVERINEAMRTAGKPDVRFECGSGDFVAILETGMSDMGGGISGGIKLSPTESMILELIRGNNHITSNELIQETGKGETTIERTLGSLKSKGIIQRAGSRKSGYWEVLK